jgi:hypothetical protein
MRVVAVSILRTVEIAFVSLALAWLELKVTEARDCWACTPGQVLAHDLLGDKHSIAAFANEILLGFATDALVWFLLIGGIALAISRSRTERASLNKKKGIQ